MTTIENATFPMRQAKLTGASPASVMTSAAN